MLSRCSLKANYIFLQRFFITTPAKLPALADKQDQIEH
jgi:hypothetical protein